MKKISYCIENKKVFPLFCYLLSRGAWILVLSCSSLKKRMENSNRTLHAYAREGRVKGIQRLLKQGKRL
jgi:hypothetical protein